MSFQNKGFWLPRDAGCLTDGEVGYDNSTRIEPKRSHQWFMDGSGTELFCNKKQAIEAHDSRPVSGISPTNAPQWHSTSNFPSLSGEFGNSLFGSEPVRTVNFVDRSTPSVNGGNLKVGKRDFQDQYNNASMDLSMSHFEDPSCLNLGGIRKVKVNQVGDSGTGLSASMGLSHGSGDNGSLSMGTTFDKRDNKTMSLGPNYINSDKNTISIGSTFGKSDFSFFSMGHTLNKGEENCISMGYNYSRSKDNISLMGRSFDKGYGNFMSIGQSSERGDSNLMSMSSYNKGRENFMSLGQTYDKANENFISVGSSYSKGGNNPIGMPESYDKGDSNIAPVSSTQDKGDSGVLSRGHNFYKGQTNTISFGGYQDEPETNPSGNIISGYNLLMGTQISAQASQEPSLMIGTQNSPQVSQEPSLSVGTQNSDRASPGLLIATQNSAQASREPSLLIGAQSSAQVSQEINWLMGTQNSVQASQEPNLMGNRNSAQDSQEPSGPSLVEPQASGEPSQLDLVEPQASQEPSQPNLVEPNVNSTVNNILVTNPRTGKPKAAKKAPSNNFPSNVKSLLSTGMLDGIPVKYVSWSREKSVKGTIKGTGYVCGCNDCNYTKALNAYEFERHANCKTKHPNNHIYFENGKTIYGVVQELKNTPQDRLFDAIQNVTGSQINQKNYRIWKASYQAATRELQRIYGKDGTITSPSAG